MQVVETMSEAGIIDGVYRSIATVVRDRVIAFELSGEQGQCVLVGKVVQSFAEEFHVRAVGATERHCLGIEQLGEQPCHPTPRRGFTSRPVDEGDGVVQVGSRHASRRMQVRRYQVHDRIL